MQDVWTGLLTPRPEKQKTRKGEWWAEESSKELRGVLKLPKEKSKWGGGKRRFRHGEGKDDCSSQTSTAKVKEAPISKKKTYSEKRWNIKRILNKGGENPWGQAKAQ